VSLWGSQVLLLGEGSLDRLRLLEKILQFKKFKKIGKDKSTISREAKKNSGKRGYQQKLAHQFTVNRKINNRLRKKLGFKTNKEVFWETGSNTHCQSFSARKL
jgi:IS30 family transposase